MKTLASLFMVLAMGLGLTACSSTDTTHDAAVIPSKARNLISQNFNSAVSVVEIDKDWGSVSEYEVTLTNGTDIKFSGSGDWKSIEMPPTHPVPAGLVPTAIAKFVAEKHAGAFINGIEKTKKGFDVELSNGVDMQFDEAGNFVKYDN